MIIDDILEKIEIGGPKSHLSFETFVLNLLKHHLIEQGKSLVVSPNTIDYGVAFAPDGIDDLEGPTAIEVTYKLETLKEKDLDKWVNNIFRHLHKTPSDRFPKNIVIISTNEKKLDEMPTGLGMSRGELDIYYWGREKLNKIVHQHRAKANEILNNLFSLNLEAAVNTPAADWRVAQEQKIHKLKESYERGQFSLFLGAGVSSSAGMPNWDNLLNSLFVAYLSREFDADKAISSADISELVSRLNVVAESSALMGARYLRKGLTGSKSETSSFVDAITKSLYELRNKKFPIHSRLLKAISETCRPRRTGARVRSVINYNFDDLLEKQLLNSGVAYRSVYTESEVYDPDELPIYHVHGFLPEDRSKYSSLENSTLVFSEEGYHHIYTNAYHWSNLVQLNCLRENNCLMIGLSMTDPNLRRLMDISARSLEQSKHFTFMKRLSIEEFCSKPNSSNIPSPISNINGAEKFLTTHHALNEALMRELGATVIWYENYDDIPKILENITS